MAARPDVTSPRTGVSFKLTPDRIVLGLILIAAAVLHGGALRLPFFADDYLFLDQVRHRSLFEVLAAPDPIGNFFRPFGRQFYFWGLSRLTAQSSIAFHAVNLGLFFAILVLLFSLARRLAGLRAAAIATAFLALHYAADVPVRWVSGSQDLIAVAGALLALWLLARGRGLWAALALFLALLSKETVVLTPLLGILVVRRGGEPWRASARRAWPLFAGAVAWALLYVAMSSRHRAGSEAAHDPVVAIAALVHLLQVTIGAEWRKDAPTRFLHLDPASLVAMVAALFVVLVAALRAWGGAAARREPRAGRAAKGRDRGAPSRPSKARAVPAGATPSNQPGRAALALWTGAAWALAGALPVAVVASIWSAYFYLFALCGVALALGGLAARLPRVVALALVALLAWGSENGRQLDEFFTGPGAWSAESHVNRFYIDRAMGRIQRLMDALKREYPTLPPRSTVFWSGVPSFLAWQVADGPLVRWAYGDSSLRSYYLSAGFTVERVQRGPVYFLQVSGDSLKDLSRSPRYYKQMALSMVLGEKFDAAQAALTLDMQRDPNDRITKYWLALVRRANDDTLGVAGLLLEAGVNPRAGPAPDLALARARAAARDTAGAKEIALRAVENYALDPKAHGLLADLLMGQVTDNATCIMEAMAHRVLAPGDPLAWRRWAYIQGISRRYIEAYASFQHYFAIGGPVAAADSAAVDWMRELSRAQPGGDYIQKGLRTGSSAGR